MIWGALAVAILSAGVVLRELGRLTEHASNRVRRGMPEDETHCSHCGEGVGERA